MSGFAPDPQQLRRRTLEMIRGHRGKHRELVDSFIERRDSLRMQMRIVDEAISALVDCETCLDRGRTITGPSRQVYGCPGCGLTSSDVVPITLLQTNIEERKP